jgi:hypothetical protein
MISDFGKRKARKARKFDPTRKLRRGEFVSSTTAGRPVICKKVTFKRKDGRLLPQSQWTTITRCEGKSAKTKWAAGAKRRKQCRVGGKGPKAHLFAPCKPGRRGMSGFGARRRRRMF